MTAAFVTREIAAELEADIAKFDGMLDDYLAGNLDEDEFRIFVSTTASTGSARAATTRWCG